MAFKMKGYSPFDKETRYLDDKTNTSGGKKIRVPSNYKSGDLVSEDDLDAQFELKTGDPKTFPQLDVSDYSRVKVDDEGPYVTKLN